MVNSSAGGMKWRWNAKHPLLAAIISIVAMVTTTFVAQCNTDGSISLETRPAVVTDTSGA